MTGDEERLIEYYERSRLPEERVDAILEAGRLAARRSRWRRRVLATSAALLLGGALAGWLFLRGEGFRGEPREPGTPTGDPSLVSEEPELLAVPSYRLVAFRQHDDGCPACRATGELYANLEGELEDDSIEFEQFALQVEGTREEAMARIESLDLTSLLEGRDETAFAVLLSPEGHPLIQFPGTARLEEVRRKISDIVDQ